MIPKNIRDKIAAQALQEIQFARTYKQGLVWMWQKNEDMYYGRKRTAGGALITTPLVQPTPSAANVELGKMQSFVHTILSKIDAPLTFKFKNTTMADLKRAKLLNALKEKDANIGDWNYKDLVGKKQAVIYGRAIYSYYADSENGYNSHLDNVDVYDFLIDPAAGGIDIDKARYLGRFGVRKSKEQIKKGVKEGRYLRTEATQLLSGSGNLGTETNQEEINQQNRYANVSTLQNRTMNTPDVYKFWEWYTTYDDERYYVLITEDSGVALRVEPLADLFAKDEVTGLVPYPFWSWSAFPDLTEFWTPSYCDYVREIFMAQNVNINQMLDNAQRTNKPQRLVDSSSIVNSADLIYKPNGNIRFKAGTDINKAFQILTTPSIDTPLKVYDTLEQIVQTESGVTPAIQGNAEEDKVAIYEGNIAQTADRFGLLNKSYGQGYKRFAKLYKNGIDEHLKKKTAVSLLGPDGYEESIFVTKRDIKPKAEYSILIESTNAEAQADVNDKKNKMMFLQQYSQAMFVNQKYVFEVGAETVGFNSDQIRQMLDVSEYGDADMMSEAERDMEDLLAGKIIEPNLNANAAYANHFLAYMKDHIEDMDNDTFLLFKDYMQRIESVVVRNMGTQLTNAIAKEGIMQPGMDGQTVPAPEAGDLQNNSAQAQTI